MARGGERGEGCEREEVVREGKGYGGNKEHISSALRPQATCN
jgi:hypothetical protein